MAAEREKPMPDAEVTAWLQQNLPKWRLEDGWIRRTYKTASWKGTVMVISTIGHLAEAAWHHPDITASYAWVEVLRTGAHHPSRMVVGMRTSDTGAVRKDCRRRSVSQHRCPEDHAQRPGGRDRRIHRSTSDW